MNRLLLSAYQRLPYAGRCLAAGVWGRYLRSWRYGEETPSLVETALERESWSPSTWTRWQEERTSRLLHRAVTQVPYYRNLWAKRRQQGDTRSWKVLQHWPILSKETVRRQPEAFLADDRPRSLFRVTTSGSTGTPLALWRSRRTSIAWYALVEARLRRWNGVERRQPWALLGGRLVARGAQRKPPFWVWASSLQQLYLSAFHLAPAHAKAYLNALHHHRVNHLLGYASAMTSLAHILREKGLEAPALTVVISNGEPLFESQRELLLEVFRCPIRDTYGMAEIASAASECSAGRLHLWPDVGFLEVIHNQSGNAAPDGQTGRLVCTGLLNEDMPLIRYETGDLGALESPSAPCPCGRQLPVLARVAGRLEDLIVTPDGRRVSRFDAVFRGNLPIREAQLVQHHQDSVRALLVPADGFGSKSQREVERRLRMRLGPSMGIEVEIVDKLERESSGKLRAVISEVAPP
ncbi:MAG: AMP-binding protein [Deltaproteobacteria bacterium]|nr:AMP-binding protein [Deltaproteobacteria bacterium]